MSDVDTLKAEVKKLSALAAQSRIDLRDLAEELPLGWQRVPEVAQRCHDLYARLTEARAQLNVLVHP
jgi:hypothetical protein